MPTLYVAVFTAATTPTWARADIANGRNGWSATGYVASTTDTSPPTTTTGDDAPGLTISGLSAGTEYKLWAIWDDGSTSSNSGTPISSAAFWTVNEGDLAATETGADTAALAGQVIV